MILINIKKFSIKILIVVMFIAFTTLYVKLPEFIYPIKYEDYVYKYSNENNLDPYLVFAIIKAESNFYHLATSHKNAKGLMQISDITGKWGVTSLNISNAPENYLYKPDINIRIGSWYLGKLKKEFNNNQDLIIAAYNAGSGNVNNWLKNKAYSKEGNFLEKIPYKETEKFVKVVKKYYLNYKSIYEK